jgi:hypothetical protein
MRPVKMSGNLPSPRGACVKVLLSIIIIALKAH